MHQINSVCVYCGSSNQVSDLYKQTARDLGAKLAAAKIDVVYGGGRVGLMGIVADSALEHGANVIGIIPSHIQEKEIEHTDLTELHVVDSMHTRKQMMVDRSDGFVILPGGLGTLDETFECMTWKQLRLHDKPIVLVNVNGYWDYFESMVDKLIKEGFAQPQHKDMITIVDRVDDVVDALHQAPAEMVEPESKWI